MSNNCDIGAARLKRIRDIALKAMNQTGWEQMDKSTQAAAVALAVDAAWTDLFLLSAGY